MDRVILEKGIAKYNGKITDLTLLGGYSNNVFEYRGNEGNFILKFHVPLNDRKAIQSELDWILFLHHNQMNVSAPISSRDGNLLEEIELEHGKQYYVTAFQKLKGTYLNPQNGKEWNENVFYLLGKALGTLHSLAKQFQPKYPDIRRPEWNEGILYKEKINVDKELCLKWKMFCEELHKLPKDRDIYGIIHGDLHIQNFYIYKNEIQLFDFGDSEYHWFVYDIAIVLYHAIQIMKFENEQWKSDFAHMFLKSFLQGYRTQNDLNSSWYEHLPFFLDYRQIYSYFYFQTTLTKEQKDLHHEVLEKMKERIRNEIPYVELKMEKIMEEIGG